jgi:PAS domain S-box-containing protein
MDFTNIHFEGSMVMAEMDLTLPSGRKMALSFVASPLVDSNGITNGAIESIRDISRVRAAEADLARLNANLEKIVRDRTQALRDEVAQRVQAEQDVKSALDYTQSIIQANPDLMVVLAHDGTVLDVNTTGEVLTGIPREKLIGTNYFRYLVDDGTHAESFARLLATGKLENQIRIIRDDGHITPVSVNATVIQGKPGTDSRIIVSAHDITRQQQDEAAIRASLEEKVILLREIHHRVKNNLQIIISLTNLQMRKTHDPVVKQIVAETQNRVRAMSLVHEKLYRSESLSQIDFADYTRYLATQLFSYYLNDTRTVKLDFALGKIMVDINTAVPLGLIMNELVSNALKHGFPDGRDGTIRISGGLEEDIITLVVADDGVGIPAELDWKNTDSLGMRLITSLVDQVGGTLELSPGKGTQFTITVRKKPDEKDPS